MRIEGNTYTAEVTSTERLKTDAEASTPAAIAAGEQDCYSVVFDVDTNAATSDFFYLKNNDNRDLHVYRIRLHTLTLDTDINVTTGVTGDPTAGTALTPINLYTGGKAANVTCEEKAGDMALTGGNIVDILYLHQRAAGETYVGWQEWGYPESIILPPNTAMVLHCVTDPTADIDGTVYFYFK
jgi:hypothetical protein